MLLLHLEIYRANRTRKEKIHHINLARDSIEYIRLSFRLLKDLKCISTKNFAFISLEINEVSKQLNGGGEFEEKKHLNIGDK